MPVPDDEDASLDAPVVPAVSELLLTVKEAAEALGLSEVTVRRLIADKAIPAVKLSPRRIRIPRAALEQWLDLLSDEALDGMRT
jgi:excisionase family DNA binding protein